MDSMRALIEVEPALIKARLVAPTLRIMVWQFCMKITSPTPPNPLLYLKLPAYFWVILRSKLNFKMYISFCTIILVFRVVKSK